MTKLVYIFLSLILFGITACQSEKKSDVDQEYELYYDSIMVIHDRTMPLMSKIENLREQLKQERKVALNSDAKNYLKINNLLAELNKAEDSMFDWMNGFNPDSIPDDKKRQYIQTELIKVQHMEGLMLGGIGMADAHIEDSQQ